MRIGVIPSRLRLGAPGARGGRLRAALVAGVLALAPTAVAVAFPATAQAATGSKWGYVWANSPTASSYTPNLAYQRQSNGKHVTIRRNSTGNYTVTFHGLASSTNGGIVQVTGDDGGGSTCQTSGWGNYSGNVQVTVLCFAPGGAPADASFDATYTVGAGTGAFAYGWDDQWMTNGPLDPAYSFDGKGGHLSSTHISTGSYSVAIPHLAGSNGTVKVTPYGAAQTFCTIAEWYSGTVVVQCADSAGSPVDTQFDITFTNRLPLLGVRRTNGYLFNSQLNQNYTDTDTYKFDSAGGTVTVTHQGTGKYEVQFGGFSQNHGDVQVTAYGGTTNFQCEINGWFGSSSVQNVLIDCFDTTGTLTDSLFTMQFTL